MPVMKCMKILRSCSFWALASILTVGLKSPVLAHQHTVVGPIGITFHAEPGDSPIANQPSNVWIHAERGDNSLVELDQCQGCRFLLLAPDGQVLNEFDTFEMQVFSPPPQGHEGAFGTSMIFGTAGEFSVQFQGTIDGQPIDILFPVSVRP